MPDYSEHIELALQMYEDYYPEFLSSTGAVDSSISRITFYGLMIETTMSAPAFPWQYDLIEIIKQKQDEAFAEFRKKLKLDPEE